MDTIYVVISSATMLTFLGLALAKIVPDNYDLGARRLAPAKSRAIRVRQ